MTVHDDSASQTAAEAPSDSSGDGSIVTAAAGPATTAASAAAVFGEDGGARRNDAIFKGVVVATGVLVIAIIAAIAIDLVVQAIPALTKDKVNFLTSSEWLTTSPDNLHFGILDLTKVTVLSSVVALIIAVPISIGIATFLVQYAPKQISRPLSTVIDLLAAVPSIIFGIWGFYVLGPQLAPVGTWLQDHLGWFFLFKKGNVSIAGQDIFTASIVLAIMILPIITSISREVIRQTPSLHQEAALALGATKWEKIRMTCFPYARSGIVAGSMLALGRALGETIAVLLILNVPPTPSHLSLFDGGSTFASKIASGAGEFSDPTTTGAFIAAGLVLFILTFVVNAIARVVAGGKVNG